MNNPKIEIIWDSELEDILGEDRVEAYCSGTIKQRRERNYL